MNTYGPGVLTPNEARELAALREKVASEERKRPLRSVEPKRGHYGWVVPRGILTCVGCGWDVINENAYVPKEEPPVIRCEFCAELASLKATSPSRTARRVEHTLWWLSLAVLLAGIVLACVGSPAAPIGWFSLLLGLAAWESAPIASDPRDLGPL